MFKLLITLISSIVLSLVLTTGPALAYKLVEIIDRSGKIIVPAKYRRAESAGAGFYYLEKQNKEHPLRLSYDGVIVDSNGNEIPVNVPSGYTLSGAYVFEESKGVNSKCLPSDSLLEIHGASGYGLCTLDGEIVLKCKYQLGKPYLGVFPVFENKCHSQGELIFMYDSSEDQWLKVPHHIQGCGSGSRIIRFYTKKERGASAYGFLTYDGKQLIEPKYPQAMPFSPEGIALTYKDPKTREPMYRDERGQELTLNPNDQSFRNSYKAIKPLKKNIWLARDLRSLNLCSISREGKLLARFPSNTRDVQVTGRDTYSCYIASEKKYERKIIFVNSKGQTLATVPGKPYGPIQDGLQPVKEYSKLLPPVYRIVDSNGRTVVPATRNFVAILSPDRFARYKTIPTFSRAIWDDSSPFGYGINRLDEFFNLLTEYNLIGMSESKLLELLGDPHSSQKGLLDYSLMNGSCGNFGHGVQLKAEDGAICAWRFYWLNTLRRNGPMMRYGSWVTSNMIRNPDYSEKNYTSDSTDLDILMPKP